MPNWCYNTVTFLGNQKNIDKAIRFITKDYKKQDAPGYKFSLLERPINKYLFDLEICDDYINFETRWSPDAIHIIHIALAFNLNFEYSYEELGCGVYGIFNFQNNKLYDRCLNDVQLSSCLDEDSCHNFDAMNHILEKECVFQICDYNLDNAAYEIVGETDSIIIKNS